jgi:hypothetical protein
MTTYKKIKNAEEVKAYGREVLVRVKKLEEYMHRLNDELIDTLHAKGAMTQEVSMKYLTLTQGYDALIDAYQVLGALQTKLALAELSPETFKEFEQFWKEQDESGNSSFALDKAFIDDVPPSKLN